MANPLSTPTPPELSQLEGTLDASPKHYHRNPHYQAVETLLEDIIGLVPTNGDNDGEEVDDE